MDETVAAEPSATVIADSVSAITGVRLTTIEVTLHRFVLSELNTHRVFSRNSASSRAIPSRLTMGRVAANPAMPTVWTREQPGMQGGLPLDSEQAADAERLWLRGRDAALEVAESLSKLGVHKSLVNRVLEPWMWHTVIISATDWDGFWEQRCSPLAMPEIRVAAEAMHSAMDHSRPNEIERGGWHLPYVREDERSLPLPVLRRVSAARCARVSYLTHDGVRDISEDLRLFRRLATARPMHASPLEHVATPAGCLEEPLGNFRGWVQYRHAYHAADLLRDDRTVDLAAG
jgi:thymidylate synthase ThyX